MTHQEILTKAMTKASRTGWLPSGDQLEANLLTEQAFCIIFNHDFAKALWGEKKERGLFTFGWKFHLQQMVVADDPIAYLGEHI
jgi:hypothetical protein